MNKIKFAIIGFGHIGRRHAEHIRHNQETELVAVCDINPQVTEYLPSREITYYPDIGDLLAATTAEVVCICTPNYLHCEHTIAVLNSGRHAVVEKPMAMSSDECDRMMAAAGN